MFSLDGPSMRHALALTMILLAGCQYDPHGDLYLTTEPKAEDVVGTYVLERFDFPQKITIAHRNVEVELHADGTFTATNVPPWVLGEPDAPFFSTLLSGTGNWEKAKIGILDPGSHPMWGVYLRTPDNRIHPAHFTGKKPPYGLIFTLGDPDSGNAILLKRRL